MASLSTRRVVLRRTMPAKMSVVQGSKGGGDLSDKENIVNCNVDSLSEARHGKADIDPVSPPGSLKAATVNILQPRKRSHNHNERTPVSEGHSPEFSTPELTTLDTLKPAKRIVGPKQSSDRDDKEDSLKQLPKIRTPVPKFIAESCDGSFPTESDNLLTPELPRLSKVLPAGSGKDSAGKAAAFARRLSAVKVGSAREGRGLVNTVSSSAKKCMSVDQQQKSGLRMEYTGKDIVFSAKKKSPTAERSGKTEAEVEKARLRTLERRSPALKTSVGKQGVGKFGGKPELLRKDVSFLSPQPDSASKSVVESIRTRKLAMVLKSEQRLAEKNEQYQVQILQLHDQMAQKEFEVERLTSSGNILNNMVSRQSDEIRELRFRLKETFNENADVRDLCEKLERELRLTSLKLAKLHQSPLKSCEERVASITTQLQSMAIGMAELRMNETSIAEGQEDSEEQELVAQDTVPGRRDGTEKLPRMRRDQEKEYSLQEMVLQEEHLLRERFASALSELNLPLTPLLTSKGSLDVDSLKEKLVSLSSREDYKTIERMSAIRRLSVWIGSS